MKYNLTDSQKDSLRFIVNEVNAGTIKETFEVMWFFYDGTVSIDQSEQDGASKWNEHCSRSKLKAFAASDLLHLDIVYDSSHTEEIGARCTLTGAAYQAVKENFKDELHASPEAGAAAVAPAEIAMSLNRFKAKYPEAQKTGFLIMRFATKKPFGKIIETIRSVCTAHGLSIVRADDHEFHADLFSNVRTYLHGCGFGIAIYERVETDEPNANVGLEVGYMLAMNKPVLLLKDQTMKATQTDLAGKLYKPFDTHDPEETLPKQINKWLADYGIVEPKGL